MNDIFIPVVDIVQQQPVVGLVSAMTDAAFTRAGCWSRELPFFIHWAAVAIESLAARSAVTSVVTHIAAYPGNVNRWPN